MSVPGVTGFNPLPSSPKFYQRVFYNKPPGAGQNWVTWDKPKGLSMMHIFAVGAGGNGGTGVVGANSVSAGGGGGGSGGQTILEIPISAVPDKLYVCIGAPNGSATYVSIYPSTTTNHVLLVANGGGNGGNAAAGTGGAAGAAGGIATAGAMSLGWAYAKLALAGQAGIIGGAAVTGTSMALPTTGLRVTGGTGGGGLPAAAATGTNGGNFILPSPTPFPTQLGGIGSATATSPAANGADGFIANPVGWFSYGGTGGASTHGTATGAGLVQARGGNGGFGSGGGGMGGALTSSTAAIASSGGNGLIIITCY